MSSDLQSTLKSLYINNLLTVVMVTTVVYDYLLTFSLEIEYIWCRSWTWVSTIFILVRYAGLLWLVIGTLVGTTFISGFELYVLEFWKQSWISNGLIHRCSVLSLVSIWAVAVFICSSDLVMILRVYAMWNQTKSILWILLSIFVPMVIITVCILGAYVSTHLSVTIFNILDFSLCSSSVINAPSMLYMANGIPEFILSVALLVLAVFQTLKQSFAMYKATKQWQPNHYMELLARDGVFYFFMNILTNIFGMIQGQNFSGDYGIVFTALTSAVYTITVVVMPRLIIGVRELYERDLRCRWQGVDTGFGIFSQLGTGQNTVVSSIAFAGVVPLAAQEDEDQVVAGGSTADDPEEICLEVRGNDEV